MSRRRGRALAALALLGAGCLGPVPARAANGSLPHVHGSRPGPAILYARVAKAPQLTNGKGWHARPILISGASAYRHGEFLYQDYLYDDHGANAGRDPNDPRSSSGTFSEPNGTYTYPTARGYHDNAADFVELRVEPRHNATAFRITYNTLTDPALVATSIAIGGRDGEEHDFPHGANAKAPADLFLTVHGHKADLLDAASGDAVGPAPKVRVDEKRRQVEVEVSHHAWNPKHRTVRLAAATGLWDTGNDRYLIPTQSRSNSRPGGAGDLSSPPAFFNVAFRYDEPFQYPTDPNTLTSPAWWRDRDQGEQLAKGDLSSFHADVDFGKLESGKNDDMHGKRGGVPTSGPMDRILASHFEPQQGADYTSRCQSAQGCKGWLRGQLQPYAIYVPKDKPKRHGYGLTLLLHSLDANYNQYSSTRNQSELGDRAPGSIVITPEGRAPDGWYYDQAGADTFEVWADVASRYRLDPDLTVVTGYSMGGYGTFKFASQFPDLFAKAQTTVGPPGLGIGASAQSPEPGGPASSTYFMLPSVRNVPFLMWVEMSDELVPFSSTQEQADRFDSLGYRYDFWRFDLGDHLALALNDEYGPVADFLGDSRVHRNPAHVTYVRNPTMDFPHDGTTADHAYWLSKIELRDAGAPSASAPRGTIDVRSLAFGQGDPVPSATQTGAGALTGGNLGAVPYTRQFKRWGGAVSSRKRDELVVWAQNIRSVNVDPKRARVSCHAKLSVQTDGPLAIRLAGCGRVARFP